MSDLLRGVAALENSRQKYDRAYDYYVGNVAEVFASARISKMVGYDEEPYYLNYARIPVATRLSRIEIAAVTVPANPAATAALQSLVWDANDLLLLQKQIHETTLVFGDAIVFVWPDFEGTGVEIDLQSPVGARVMYRADSPRRPEYAIRMWPHENGTYRVNLYYADRIEKYISINGRPGAEEQWLEYTDGPDGEWVIPNPFGVLPVFHFSSNGSPYGMPVHRNAFGPQDSITKLNATLNATVEFMGFPQRYALSEASGVDAADADDFGGFGASDFVDGSEAGTGVKGGNLRGGPREIMFLQGIKAVGAFETGDAANFLESLTFQIKSMAQVTETPMHYFDPAGGAPSGESLRVADAPLVKSVEDLKLGMTRPWSNVLSFALEILGIPGQQVDVRWTDSASSDDKDGWETAGLKLAAGVPLTQVLLENGYTAEQVANWLPLAPGTVGPVVPLPEA